MAFGLGEDPRKSVTTVLTGTSYPTARETLVEIAEDAEATADVINLVKSLPQNEYRSELEVLRDLAEAARRFGMSNRDDDDGVNRDRRDIGREAVEHAPPPLTRHP